MCFAEYIFMMFSESHPISCFFGFSVLCFYIYIFYLRQCYDEIFISQPGIASVVHMVHYTHIGAKTTLEGKRYVVSSLLLKFIATKK